MRKSTGWVVASVLALPAAASAQDFGREWLDRVTHTLEQERGPLTARPLEWHAGGGVAYVFDDNVYLRGNGAVNQKVSDSVIIPFISGKLRYVEPRFEVEADLLANYKFYVNEEAAEDDEERFYGRLRQTGNRYSLELVQLVQHASDPADVQSALDTTRSPIRASRVVWNTVPRVIYDFDRSWSIEGQANFQMVYYQTQSLADRYDNTSLRADGSLVYRASQTWDFVANGGVQNIGYQGSPTLGAPVDAWGWFIRGGFRAQVVERLYVNALAGYSRIESDFFPNTTTDVKDRTFEAAVDIRFEVTETLVLRLDYNRSFAFAGAGDPYQRVDRVLALLDWELFETVSIHARLQLDHAKGALGVVRNYYAAGATATFKVSAWLAIDAGVTFRDGDESGGGAIGRNYQNLILHVGFGATY
jgi:hypothetical protein